VEIPLAVVGPRYRPLQNSDAFDFFDSIVDKNAAVFETAGALGYGERVWVLAKVPGEMHIVGDDYCGRYLLLSNSHDGKGTVAIKFTPIRVVCQNTLILALENGEKAYTVRHTKNMDERLAEVQKILATVWKTFVAAVMLFRSLAAVPIKDDRLDQYLERVYPRKPAERDNELRLAKWDAITELFEQGDVPLKPSHTLWGAYNAVARYEDYRETNEAGPDRRLNRVWFGAGAELKLKALQEANALRQQ
jgi:phage/plasmid-like protein (TIGR03299 family)